MRFIFALMALVVIGCTGCSSLMGPSADATEFSVNPMFSDNMVVQREMQIPVWGKAKPGQTVVLRINGNRYSATANKDGKWFVKLNALPVGGPYVLAVEGKGKAVVMKNVLCGDVWICSGQSNMQWTVARSKNSAREIAAANYPKIRLFSVKRKVSTVPLDKVSGSWHVCSPQTVRNFSAVGYFFGRDLYKELKIPIGLIHTSWGGTPAEAWTEQSLLSKDPILKPIMDRHHQKMKNYPEALKKYKKAVAKFKKSGNGYHKDIGDKGKPQGWHKPDFNDSKWNNMKLPQFWESKHKIDGAVWFRKTLNIPSDWAGKDLKLSIAMVDDFDNTYFNGVKVGGLGAETKNAWRTRRQYVVPGKIVKAGKAVIAVRVFDRFGAGGIHGDFNNMYLTPVKKGNRIKLAGNWKYKIERKLKAKKYIRRPRTPYGENHSHYAGGLYNAMINPIIPYGIKGAIWYQGETNASRGWQYRTLLPTMINCWRKAWNQGDFPFLIVQLANFKPAQTYPGESAWAELREAQALTSEKVANCGLAVAIDIGEARDIHPKNKQDVGKRLELAALKVAYGENVVYSGPTYLSYKVEGNKMIITFKNIGGGLVAKGGSLKRFQVAGEDKKFVWATAKIEGSTVVVSSSKVKVPVAVRYAWSDNPEGCNLYNKEGLPAVPFRTDSWTGVTDKNR